MPSRYKHMMGIRTLNIEVGEIWTRKPSVIKINNPLNIEIVNLPEGVEDRFYVRNIYTNAYIFFFREDIVNNYDKRIYTKKLSLDEQICEIKGWRYVKDRGGDIVFISPKDKTEVPRYTDSPLLCDKLMLDLQKYEPKIKITMGSFTLYLNKSYTGITREEAICKAWIDKNI